MTLPHRSRHKRSPSARRCSAANEGKLDARLEDLTSGLTCASTDPCLKRDVEVLQRHLEEHLAKAEAEVRRLKASYPHHDGFSTTHQKLRHEVKTLCIKELEILAQLDKRFRKRSTLSLPSKRVLCDWLEANRENPYPTKEQKEKLAAHAGISCRQLTIWLTNARARKAKKQVGRLLAEVRLPQDEREARVPGPIFEPPLVPPVLILQISGKIGKAYPPRSLVSTVQYILN